MTEGAGRRHQGKSRDILDMTVGPEAKEGQIVGRTRFRENPSGGGIAWRPTARFYNPLLNDLE